MLQFLPLLDQLLIIEKKKKTQNLKEKKTYHFKRV